MVALTSGDLNIGLGLNGLKAKIPPCINLLPKVFQL